MTELCKVGSGVELALIKSLLAAEEIRFHVRGEHFAALEIGPPIEGYNTVTIFVDGDQAERAQEILAGLRQSSQAKAESLPNRYSFVERLRMIAEAFLFGWFVPGPRGRKQPKQ